MPTKHHLAHLEAIILAAVRRESSFVPVPWAWLVLFAMSSGFTRSEVVRVINSLTDEGRLLLSVVSKKEGPGRVKGYVIVRLAEGER